MQHPMQHMPVQHRMAGAAAEAVRQQQSRTTMKWVQEGTGEEEYELRIIGRVR